jgi:hypothetical protein
VLYRQVVKKEIKLEAVDDRKEMIKLQQKVDQLVYEAIAREKLISQSQVTPLEKQYKLNIKDLNSC